MIDRYLAELDGRLRGSARVRARTVDEVRDHLDDAVARLQSEGCDEATAGERAVAAFGSAAVLARQLNAQTATATMRRTPIAVGASGAALVFGFLLAALTQPQPAVPKTAGIVVQVAFFVAVVGLQVAAVAGARAAVLVAARWRSAAAPVADRRLVRDAAVICVGGLIVAALGWTLALIGAIGNRPEIRTVTLVAGIVVMAGAALTAALTASFAVRHGYEDAADAGDADTGTAEVWVGPTGVLLGLGERAVGVVRRWPVPVCAVVAIVGGLLAMAGAETTVVGALPSGLFEAAAVVGGFIVLRPRLGLRARQAS